MRALLKHGIDTTAKLVDWLAKPKRTTWSLNRSDVYYLRTLVRALGELSS